MKPAPQLQEGVACCAAGLFEAMQSSVHRQTDRMFAALLFVQWLAGIGAALLISPRTWIGAHSSMHIHVWMAALLGGAIASLPIYLALAHPGKTLTRNVIAVGQMLASALLIHLTGGRIETHFHVFGSLAFLAFYRDWRVFVPAVAVVALDHFVRGVYWPESVFGVVAASSWRWIEHAGWVLFETIFLVYSCVRSVKEMRQIALTRAELEATNARVEAQVLERTAALSASESRFRALSVSAPIGIFQADTRGRCVFVNPWWEAITGRGGAHWAGRPWTEALHEEDAQRAGSLWEACTGSGAPFQLECRLRSPERGERWARVTAGPTGGDDDRLWIGAVEDVTEERAAAETLRNAAQAAEEANRLKSEFLANMSHEIRTPMTAIIGYTDLMLDASTEPGKRAECAETIRRNGKHLLRIINDILDLSKVEAGKLEIERTACAPEGIVQDVASLLGARAREKGLRFDMRVNPDAPGEIVTDPLRLRQVLMNLVGNAVKFTDVGGVEVRVRGERGGGHVAFEISDTGIGMSSEQVERIWTPFTQADASMSRRFGGSGLGLAICRRLAERMGGVISVKSREGEGSVFTLTLPAGDPDEPGVRREPAQPSLAASTRANPEAIALRGRILLAEDGPDNQRLLTAHMKRAGAEVAVACNGREAVAMTLRARDDAQPFDLILMDMQMPVMDGYTATRALRDAGVTLPIVAVTAHAMREDRDKCLDAGCDDFLSKPVTRGELLAMCAHHLGIENTARAEPAG